MLASSKRCATMFAFVVWREQAVYRLTAGVNKHLDEETVTKSLGLDVE